MNISDYEFYVGDKVITTDGETGKIIKICTCDKCVERGFCEPVWIRDSDGYEDYITAYEARSGLNGYYQIGKYHFHDFKIVEVLRDIDCCENKLERLRKQLRVMEEYKSECKT